ncbi:MAG: tetratricopeptide repeat protein, partial [Planctomycetota bacterium]
QDLGVAYQRAGRPAESAEQFRQALELDPSLQKARRAYAGTLIAGGNHAQAAQLYADAVEIMPDNEPLRYDYGMLLLEMGDDAGAAEQLGLLLDSDPVDPITTMKSLAWVLATSPDPDVRDVAQALQLVDRLVAQAAPDAVDILDIQAIVLAEDGRFDEAIEAAQQAVQLADPATPPQLLREYQARLALYQAHGRVSDQRRR